HLRQTERTAHISEAIFVGEALDAFFARQHVARADQSPLPLECTINGHNDFPAGTGHSNTITSPCPGREGPLSTLGEAGHSREQSSGTQPNLAGCFRRNRQISSRTPRTA